MKNFARDRVEALTRRDKHLLTGQEEIISAARAPDDPASVDKLDAAKLHADLLSVIQELPDRERELLTHHYGLDQNQPALSPSPKSATKWASPKQESANSKPAAQRKLRQLLDAKLQNRTPSVSESPHLLFFYSF